MSMAITVSEEKLGKVLTDVETLVTDMSSLFEREDKVKKRLAEIKANPALGRTEQELDAYLKKRGVKIDGNRVGY